MIEAITHMDVDILLAIQAYLRIGWLTPIMIFITTLGNAGMIWILISGSLCISKKTRSIGVACIIALLLSLLINNVILKNLIMRPRPFAVISNLSPLIAKPTDWSFPSGHTAASFSCAWLLFRQLPKKYGVSALILAILISFSRLYLGVHFPSDVVMGMVSGILISYLAELIAGKLQFIHEVY